VRTKKKKRVRWKSGKRKIWAIEGVAWLNKVEK